MEVTGTIKVITDAVQVSDKFKKREFVVTTNEGQYPQDILLQLTQDKCDLINDCVVGQEVKALINLRGREWTSPKGEIKYFNTLECWKIEKGATSTIKETPQNGTALDDLPF